MELEILLPFPSAETMTESWAFSEAQIDFRHDPEAGARCTISYAAVELRTHLLQMEPDAQICFVSQRHSGKAAIEWIRSVYPTAETATFALAADDLFFGDKREENVMRQVSQRINYPVQPKKDGGLYRA